jgi:hypothetical protein
MRREEKDFRQGGRSGHAEKKKDAEAIALRAEINTEAVAAYQQRHLRRLAAARQQRPAQLP